VAVVVAHPDDEALWVGGLLLGHPQWTTVIVTLCRGQDPDRAPKFRKVLERLGAQGAMGDLDDGPEQTPLADEALWGTILGLLPGRDFDLLLTHGPAGEYTRHRRHEEASRSVEALWRQGVLRAGSLWQFAYEDGGGAYLPRPRADADQRFELPADLWARKRDLITRDYGFAPDSWEARTVPDVEAFRSRSLGE
jgi:LmbE family N-acetylglucosaminyl deacetylase